MTPAASGSVETETGLYLSEELSEYVSSEVSSTAFLMENSNITSFTNLSLANFDDSDNEISDIELVKDLEMPLALPEVLHLDTTPPPVDYVFTFGTKENSSTSPFLVQTSPDPTFSTAQLFDEEAENEDSSSINSFASELETNILLMTTTQLNVDNQTQNPIIQISATETTDSDNVINREYLQNNKGSQLGSGQNQEEIEVLNTMSSVLDDIQDDDIDNDEIVPEHTIINNDEESVPTTVPSVSGMMLDHVAGTSKNFTVNSFQLLDVEPLLSGDIEVTTGSTEKFHATVVSSKDTIVPSLEDYGLEAVIAEEFQEFDETTIESINDFEVEAVLAEENIGAVSTTISPLIDQDAMNLAVVGENEKIEETMTETSNYLEIQAVVAEESTQRIFEQTTITNNILPENKPLTILEVQALEAEFDSDNFIEFTETTTGTFFKGLNSSIEDPETTQRGFKDSDSYINLNFVTSQNKSLVNHDEGFDNNDDNELDKTTVKMSVAHTIQETTSRQIIPLSEFLQTLNLSGKHEDAEKTMTTEGFVTVHNEIQNLVAMAVQKSDPGIMQVNFCFVLCAVMD
jgi:hypothetical protein